MIYKLLPKSNVCAVSCDMLTEGYAVDTITMYYNMIIETICTHL